MPPTLTATLLRPEEVASLLRDPNEKIIVVDVRDDDFVGGHIVGARNIPSDNFSDEDRVDSFLNDTQAYSRVIFHCMFSQVRGPKCAKAALSRANIVFGTNSPRPEICVLKGGYTAFVSVRVIMLAGLLYHRVYIQVQLYFVGVSGTL